MFSAEKVRSIDLYDVTSMSRNTEHYWYLYNPEYPTESSVVTNITPNAHTITNEGTRVCGRQ